MADLARLTNDINIRRAKKMRNSQNDARIKVGIERYDAGACTRLQSPRIVSHSLGSHMDEFTVQEDSDDNDEEEQQQHLSQLTLVYRLHADAGVICCHSRFCTS